MKMFALFIYDEDEPKGGFNDFYGQSKSKEELIALADLIVREEKYGFFNEMPDLYLQIVDLEACAVVETLKWNREKTDKPNYFGIEI